MRGHWLTLLCFLPAMLLLAMPPAAAHDLLPRGPQVGVAIPHDLSAVDQDGAPTDFARLKAGRGMVLLFTRSLDW
tara:strand:- start:446 stop:670 length:225 start_codon:yes stop_codon:yes gene_type:complete